MFKDRDEALFYSVSGLALSLLFWGFGFFGLRGNPLGILLLLSAFFLNLLLTQIGESVLGKEGSPVLVVFISALLAFFIAWGANLGGTFLGSLALPVAVMFLLPSLFHYLRQAMARRESDVQTR